jgi:glycosyltransferase involved in cell wall biosynthesis
MSNLSMNHYSSPPRISVVINTYNAEKHLEKVLDSVKQFDEIVICDMYSTDKTLEIARKYNCRIVYHKKEPFVEPARNFAIQSASYEWVLLVDADEVISDELRQYLYNFIQNVDDKIKGLKIPRRNFFMGRFMHGTYPDHILRFFRKSEIIWPSEIHLQPKVKGIIIKIPAKRRELAILHLADESIEELITKTNIYTTVEIPKRKNKKINFASLFYKPCFTFFKVYILKSGFKDGKAGFIYAYFKGMYKFIMVAKILELQDRNNKLEHKIIETND